MNKRNIFLIPMITICSLFLISGCGKKGIVIKNGPAGPNTGDLIDPLPDSLVGDKENSLHSNETLKPVIN